MHERTAICESQLEPIIENFQSVTRGAKQGFGCWFADGLYRGLVSSAMQAILTVISITNIHNIHVRGGKWSIKNSGSCKILVEFHRSCSLVFFCGYVRLAVSSFIQSCLWVSLFRKAKGLQVLFRLLTCFYLWLLFVTGCWILMKQLSNFQEIKAHLNLS